jgi:hypothetical protein
MRFPLAARDVPGRLATGGFILRSGLKKWNGAPEVAAGVHGMASGAFPFLGKVSPERFLRILAAGEIATGIVLLTPVVPSEVAGLALTGFSGALLTMYLRTPGLHEPGSIWPTQAGTAVSKDVWMLGIGLGMVADAVAGQRRSRAGC